MITFAGLVERYGYGHGPIVMSDDERLEIIEFAQRNGIPWNRHEPMILLGRPVVRGLSADGRVGIVSEGSFS